MNFVFTFILCLFHYLCFVNGDKVHNVRRKGVTAESNEPVKRQNFETTDMITNNSEGRLLIQWKRIVTDNAASTDIDLEMLKKKEFKSI